MNKIVASALIRNNDNKFLLIRLNKENKGGVLVPPDGKLEDNESLRDCVIREVKEELNLVIEVDKLAGVSEEYENGIWTFIFFLSHIESGELKIMEKEKILDFSWKDLNKMKGADKVKWLDSAI